MFFCVGSCFWFWVCGFIVFCFFEIVWEKEEGDHWVGRLVLGIFSCYLFCFVSGFFLGFFLGVKGFLFLSNKNFLPDKLQTHLFEE